jgi:predicted CoA-binding protein
MKQTVAVIGASPNPERYSNQAVRLLRQQGHAVVPVNPGHAEVEGLAAVRRVDDLEAGTIDTVTLYVAPAVSAGMTEALAALAPRRVIVNPGAENPELADALRNRGIDVIDACTLVLLRTGQF